MEERVKSDYYYLLEREAGQRRGTLSRSEGWLQGHSQALSSYGPMSWVAVYFPISAKFILFSASFDVVSSPIESQRVHFPPSLVPHQSTGWSGTSDQIAIGV